MSRLITIMTLLDELQRAVSERTACEKPDKKKQVARRDLPSTSIDDVDCKSSESIAHREEVGDER
jgi:hypothetical protein